MPRSTFTKQHAIINGQRDKEAEKLTPSMWMMIHDIHLHNDPLHSRLDPQSRRGAYNTELSLHQRGLVTIDNKLTAKGLTYAEVEWVDGE